VQGPYLPELIPWLTERAAGYDVVVFFTYLYYPTWAGLRATAGRAATVLHATAHDEPAFHLPLFDEMLHLPTAYAFSVEEEAALLERRGVHHPVGGTIGIGTDLDASGDGDRFRSLAGIGDRPYLLYVGRVDPGKGATELYEYFVEWKRHRSKDLALVFVGDPVSPLPSHPDVIMAGFVDEQTKRDALAGALALVQPSYFESFSMVLSEAWAQARPALVQGRNDVLVGQSRRSGGGLPYTGYAEFDTALEMIENEPITRMQLGEAGRRYVQERYGWEMVMDRYERLLTLAVSCQGRRN
jgi:glycosyltransferase involved in cell wall biosynthesis